MGCLEGKNRQDRRDAPTVRGLPQVHRIRKIPRFPAPIVHHPSPGLYTESSQPQVPTLLMIQGLARWVVTLCHSSLFPAEARRFSGTPPSYPPFHGEHFLSLHSDPSLLTVCPEAGGSAGPAGASTTAHPLHLQSHPPTRHPHLHNPEGPRTLWARHNSAQRLRLQLCSASVAPVLM